MSKSVKKPTGLSITRTGRKFKASWKEGANYTTTQYQWAYRRNNKWYFLSAHTTSAKPVTHEFSAPIQEVKIYVRGRFGLWSDWAEKAIRIYVPKTPDVSAEFVQTAKTTFTWNPVTDNHERPIKEAIVQTILVKDCPDGRDAIASLPEWSDENNMTEYIQGESGSITPVDGEGEDTGLLSGKSYTRIVRVKEVGIGGESGWGYAKHIYAAPYPATNIRGTVKKTEASLNCQMYWETPTDAGHPIDEDGVVPQYSIAKPAAGMTCPDDASFEPLPPQGSTEGTEGKCFTIDTAIGIDKALFLRVTTQHDTDVVQSNAVLAGGDSVGALKLPAFTEAPAITASSVTVKATNESEVEDSFIVDYLERADGSLEILGLHDTPTKVYQVSGIENARVGIKAYVGEWNSVLKTINNIQMESAMLWSAGNVPVAPSVDDFDVEQSTVANNTVLVGWKYSWDDADACEVSWSTEPDAWMSTEDPEYYVVLRGLENKLAIKGVDPGEPLYVRIRYMNGFDDDAILSPYSDIKSTIISTVPAIPTLTLEKQYYTKDEDITCSWVYITTDGTEQAHAQIAEKIVTTVGGSTNISYEPKLDVDTEQRAVLKNKWPVGTQHALAVKVANSSGNWSEWSEAVVITIAEPISCEITQASLISESEGYELQSLPMTVTVTGAGAAGRTVLMIERTDDYRIERPEGEDFRGNVGEVVWQKAYPGEGQQKIILDDLQGHLDDGAKYRIYALVYDEYGQDDDDEIPFIVNWRHKATKPNATVDMTDIAKITIAQSALAEEGDYVDIYRRSIDGAELIYTGAQFGETYVDPYPTIGNFGYLIVGRSVYGDYVMEEAEEDYGQLAWRSVPAEYSSEKTLIDFNGDRIELYYNVDVSHSWAKDFKKTKYLGGSIVGDYVAGIERTASINFVSIPMIEEDMLESMRRLAEYEGEVHIRTREGSSFTACVQVNEDDNHDKDGFVRSFSLTVDKVDPVRLDGMTEAEWEEQNAVE